MKFRIVESDDTITKTFYIEYRSFLIWTRLAVLNRFNQNVKNEFDTLLDAQGVLNSIKKYRLKNKITPREKVVVETTSGW